VEEDFVRDKGLAHTNTHPKNKNDSTLKSQILKRFQQIELLAKLLDYFLLSNTSNINQSHELSHTSGNTLHPHQIESTYSHVKTTQIVHRGSLLEKLRVKTYDWCQFLHPQSELNLRYACFYKDWICLVRLTATYYKHCNALQHTPTAHGLSHILGTTMGTAYAQWSVHFSFAGKPWSIDWLIPIGLPAHFF